MKTSQLLTEAKKQVCDGTPNSPGTSYICLALSAISIKQSEKIRQEISNRLEGHPTLSSWLRSRKVKGITITPELVQKPDMLGWIC